MQIASGSEFAFEQVNRNRLDCKRNLKASFGNYVQAHRTKVDRSMATRADGGILLHESGNTGGSRLIYSLDTDRLIEGNRLDILLTREIVNEIMNRICADESNVRGIDPIFDVEALGRVVD